MDNDEDLAGLPAVDMEHVARRALGMRGWWLEFECHGAPFNWRGDAASEMAAEKLARYDLAVKRPEFDADKATLTVCIER